ncbi:MAG: Holliday junction resolvase RuvX [Firmicutes bacterium]|nr:Holliday junction resolvase RuvX [Bacillota bacterium]
MRILGLDVGDKRIGVAVSDPLGVTARGVAVIRREDEERDLERLGRLARELGVGRVVVGLPRRTDGTLGSAARAVGEFAARLERALGIPVVLWDERFTSAAAERLLVSADVRRARRRRVIDKVAAALILQNYLEARRSGFA